MQPDYAKDMKANQKRRHEIYEEMEKLTVDLSLSPSESYEDYCRRYAQLREEMLWLYSLLPKETEPQRFRRMMNQWARQNGALWILWVGAIVGPIEIVSGLSDLSGEYPEVGVLVLIAGLLTTVFSFWILSYQSDS